MLCCKYQVKTLMKKDIHPKYYNNAKVQCACGNSFSIGSTKDFIEIEICSNCHPFYTGKEKMIDAMGRVEKFKKRLEKKSKIKNQKSGRGAKAPLPRYASLTLA